MSELKPCPFCGDTKPAIQTQSDTSYPCQIECGNPLCCCRTPWCAYDKVAIATWNARAMPAGTIITKDDSTLPADGQAFIRRHPVSDGTRSNPVYDIYYAGGRKWLNVDCIWWPADGMFEPLEDK